MPTNSLNVEYPVMSNPKQMAGDPVRAAVNHLLFKAPSLPCHTVAQAFSQLVQPSSRFQLALDALLPDLTSHEEQSRRILASFLLYYIYAPHPITINPFKSALFSTFVKEREQAIKSEMGGTNTTQNEQLVYVLWKILKGAGNDIGPYSPDNLARSPLPSKLRPPNLTLDEETFRAEVDDYHTDALPMKRDPPSHLQTGPEFYSTAPGVPAITQQAPDHHFVPLQLEQQQPQYLASLEDIKKNEQIAQAIQLVLAARNRVLTLSEQRFLIPFIPHLTSPPVITSLDLSPLISHNPTLAHPLLVSLISNSISASSSSSSSSVNDAPLFPTDVLDARTVAYLDVLLFLPPTLTTFDFLGRLLRDTTRITIGSSNSTTTTTVSDLIRTAVLGRFLHESINWLDRAELQESHGLVSDDRFAKGVQNLCRFYSSLIKLSIVDITSDAESTEMTHFSLRNARFEEAKLLYRTLMMGKYILS